MAWRVSFRPSALRELEKLPPQAQSRILAYLDDVTAIPRSKGGPLKVGKRERTMWRYRVGDIRLVCHIREGDRVVLVLRVAQRREAYR